METKTEESGKKSVRSKIAILSLLASVALHALFLIPAFLSNHGRLDTKLEWMESFDDLEGLSTESGRWAKIEPPKKEEEKSTKEEPDIEEIVEIEVEVDPPKIEKKPRLIPSTKPKPIAKKKKKKKKIKLSTKETKKETKEEKKKSEDILYDRSGPAGLPNISGYGPGNAVYSAMVRTDRIRGTAFEKAMRDLMSRIPDYRIVLENTTIDPIQNIDMLYIASAKPKRISETFLAMKHRMTNGLVMKKLDRRFRDVPPWTQLHKKPIRALLPVNDVYQDERKIFLAKNGLALLGKEKWLKKLYKKDTRGRSSMMATLNKIENAATNDQSLILVTGRRIRVPMPGLGQLIFQSAKLEVSNIKTPDLLIELGFEDAKKSESFAKSCPRMKRTLLSKMGFLKLAFGYLVERLHCETKDEYVLIRGRYTQEEVLKILNLIHQFIPRPRMLDQLPAPPSLSDLRKTSGKGVPPSTEPSKNLSPNSDSDPHTDAGKKEGRDAEKKEGALQDADLTQPKLKKGKDKKEEKGSKKTPSTSKKKTKKPEEIKKKKVNKEQEKQKEKDVE